MVRIARAKCQKVLPALDQVDRGTRDPRPGTVTAIRGWQTYFCCLRSCLAEEFDLLWRVRVMFWDGLSRVNLQVTKGCMESDRLASK